MKFFELKMRLIALLGVMCCLICVVSQVAQAQSPKSGAMLSIDNASGSGITVHAKIYDSQIHSGTVQAVPVGNGTSNCNSVDATFPTDAYVLQGGSWTGCDPGDAFEVTDNNANTGHQAFGQTDVSGLHIETHYRCGAANASTVTPTSCSGGITSTTPACNTSGTICANPDTGLLTVSNPATNTSSFTGTITLQGNSLIAGDPFCPVGGVASDSFTGTLAPGGSVTLALGSQGAVGSPKAADSSNCGGFNAPQTQTLVAGTTSIFPIGNDDYQTTPFNNATGDALTVLPIPVPAGPLTTLGKYGSETVAPLASRFSATNFSSQTCIAYQDLSAIGNPVCLEFQLSCLNGTSTCADALTFLYTSQLDFTKDTNSLTTIGGTAFLGQHDGSPTGFNGLCPTNGFNLNVFLQYAPTAPDPIKGGGTGNSCYVGTFDPTAAPVPVGNTLTQKTFVGFQSPVVNCSSVPCVPQSVQAGSAIPLIWQTFDASGNGVTNLTLCTDFTGATCPTTTPWVFLGFAPISCTSDTSSITTLDDAGVSGLQNLGGGTYQFNWKTTKSMQGSCATPVLGFSTGFWSFDVAEFKFK